MPAVVDESAIAEILGSARVLAVVGIHDDPRKPANYVPAYLHDRGYRVLGVNPRKLSAVLFGEPVRASLSELRRNIDVVLIFRRSAAVPEHQADILAMRPLPKTVWLQLGIRNDDVERTLGAHGINVVSDRCALADHRSFGLGRAGEEIARESSPVIGD